MYCKSCKDRTTCQEVCPKVERYLERHLKTKGGVFLKPVCADTLDRLSQQTGKITEGKGTHDLEEDMKKLRKHLKKCPLTLTELSIASQITRHVSIKLIAQKRGVTKQAISKTLKTISRKSKATKA